MYGCVKASTGVGDQLNVFYDGASGDVFVNAELFYVAVTGSPLTRKKLRIEIADSTPVKLYIGAGDGNFRLFDQTKETLPPPAYLFFGWAAIYHMFNELYMALGHKPGLDSLFKSGFDVEYIIRAEREIYLRSLGVVQAKTARPEVEEYRKYTHQVRRDIDAGGGVVKKYEQLPLYALLYEAWWKVFARKE
jgi:hypothetical protein